jgi:hypothetical protein
MLLAGTTRGIATAPGGWRPDPRATLALACCGAAVLCLAFLGLLYRPPSGAKPALLSLSVVHAPLAAHRAGHPAPALSPANPSIPLPHLEALPPIPGFILLPEQVDAAVRDTVLSGQNGPFLVPSAQKYDELDLALQAPSKPGTLREGEGYRSAYGYKMMKSGDGCAAMEQVLVGPVAKADVGFMVPCPGEQRTSMADELAEWADKRAREVKAPPR